MKKSPLNFAGIAASLGAGTNISMGGANANSTQAQNVLAQSLSGITGGITGGIAGAANTFQQDPSYVAADANIMRASSGGSGSNYSTSSDPSAVYGDGLTGQNSQYADGRGSDLTRLLHDNGMFNGPQAGGLMQSKGQRDQKNKFLASNSTNAATANNFSTGAQDMAGTIYGTPESMNSSITPPMTENIDQIGMNSLYS